MPELGETGDPAALVPGDPAAMHETAWAMSGYAESLAETAARLARIGTVQGWSGAAADGFRAELAAQAGRWRDAADCFRAAATAVEDHAVVLESAQRRAGDAAALWAAQAPAAVETLTAARSLVAESGDRAAAVVEAARDRAPSGPGLWSEVGATASQTAAEAGNALASFGNAGLRHPGSVLAVLGGAGLASVSAVGVVGSLAADATGVGATIGVPVGGVSAAGVAGGVALGAGGAIDLALSAAGPDRVTPFQVNEDSAPPADPPPFGPPKITGFTKHGAEQAEGRDNGVGVADDAIADAVEHPIREPEYRASNRTYRYEGARAIVSLNENGEVVTTWAKNREGWRNR